MLWVASWHSQVHVFFTFKLGCSESFLNIISIAFSAGDTLCPDLFDPDNGEVILSGRSVGSLAQYSCGVGFILTGREVRVCQRSGDWNGTAPTCIRENSVASYV